MEPEPTEEWLHIKGEAEQMHMLLRGENETAMETLYSCRQQNISSDVALQGGLPVSRAAVHEYLVI